MDGGDDMDSSPNLDTDLRNLLHNVLDIPMKSLVGEATFEDLEIDSWTVTEVLAELHEFLQVAVSLVNF